MEQHNLRQRGQELLKLKMEKHGEKMIEIFEGQVERPASDSEGDDVPISREAYVVRISRLSRVMKDIGKYVGLAFNHF